MSNRVYLYRGQGAIRGPSSTPWGLYVLIAAAGLHAVVSLGVLIRLAFPY